MTLSLIQLYGLHRDPIHFGWTQRGISFGTTVTLGRSWAAADPLGGEEAVAAVGLFRGAGFAEDITYDSCVGLGLGKATTVKEGAFLPRAADTWYTFETRAINGAGVIGHPGGQPVRIHTDGAGKVEQIPNPPTFLSATALPGGKARVAIGYSPDGQVAEPTDLQVFTKQLTDPTDTSDLSGLYDTPLIDDVTGSSELPFVADRLRYTFNVPPQAAGTYLFGAKFRNASGVGNGDNVISNVVELSAVTPPIDLEFGLL